MTSSRDNQSCGKVEVRTDIVSMSREEVEEEQKESREEMEVYEQRRSGGVR